MVVVGGGLAGHRIAWALQGEAEVTLIDPKDYFEVPMAAPRMLVEPARSDDAILPFAEFLPRVRHVLGKASEIRPEFVRVGEAEIPFDYLVVATGAGYADDLVKPHAGSAVERRAHFRHWAGRIREAKEILIVGGGPVGVELAGEILEDLPGKKVTLMHSGPALLPLLRGKPPAYALSFLRERGAEVRLNEQVTAARKERAEVVLWCAGYRIDTGYLRGFPGNVLDSHGQVLVDAELRMAGSRNIFVAGDITALPEPKLGIWAGRHAAVVIANIRCLLRGKAGLRTYRPATGNRMMLVTLGRNHGTGHIPLGDFTNSWFARRVKSRDMFIGRYRKAVGLAVR